VLLLLIQLGQFIQLVELAVDPGADEAMGAQLIDYSQVFALALEDHRRQQHQLATLR
jgi:hypothetical protein